MRYTIAICLPVLLLVACAEQPEKRVYTEIVIDAPPPVARGVDEAHRDMRDMALPAVQRSSGSAEFSWTAPAGWREEPGTGMRLATLWVEDGECTLIVLSGDVGGLAANIARWMDQVQLRPLSPAQMQSYIEGLERFETSAGLSGLLLDFDEFVQDAAALSTLGGIIQRGPETMFVKLTGSKSLLARERDNFITLCKSIY
jgi:hypothetical protein